VVVLPINSYQFLMYHFISAILMSLDIYVMTPLYGNTSRDESSYLAKFYIHVISFICKADKFNKYVIIYKMHLEL